MKASFQGITAAAKRHAAQSGFALAALVAGSMFATASAVAQPMERWSVEPLIDMHDFINPEESPDAISSTIELEKFFWMCDYAATTDTLDAHEIQVCGAVTEKLRLVKFDGDVERLLAWWRVSKETEHRALAGTAVIGHCAQGDKR